MLRHLFLCGPVTLGPRQYWLLLHAWNWLIRIGHNVRITPPNPRGSPILISQFQACNKSQYCLGPSVTGPHRKRCLNIYHGLHCIRTDQWKGISILTMVNIEIRTSRTMQGRINKEMKFNISHGWYWNKSNRTLKGRINKDMNSNIIHGWYWNKSI